MRPLLLPKLAPRWIVTPFVPYCFGLIISGGMLIPGNIPNIIAAGKLNITSKEWAAFGVPIGLLTMALYFVVLFAF